jgi:anaerobic selenocysteine-containing dehydrogenase
MTRSATTFCRICAAQCGMLLDVDDSVDGGRIVGVRGDPAHPFTKGYLCAKGRAIGDAHHSPNRLTGAHVGRGEDRCTVPIAEGHANLAAALQGIVAEHGTGAIGVFHGTGAFSDALGTWTARRFKKALGSLQMYSTATVDAVAKTLVASEMGGTPLLIPQIDEDAGRLLVFVGINPVVSHGHATMFSNPVERIRAARARGPVFTLDPRSSETARLSDHHLALRPGTDYAVFAHLIRALLASGDVDLAALAGRASGVETLAAAVESFDATTTASITGLPVEQLDLLLASVRDAGRLAILSGTGSTMNPAANLGEWMAWALMVITDSFDQPGGMWFNPGVFSRLDRFDTLPRAAAAEPRSAARPDVARCGGEWPAALIPDEIEAGRLRALVVLGANLITALPEPDRVAKALGEIDVLVVIDVVHNDTSALATHVFASAGQLERPDVLCLEPNANVTYQQYTDPVVAPLAERPPMWQTLARIASGIGLDALGGEEGVDPLATTPEAMFARLARGDGVAALKARGGFHAEPGPRYGWVRSRLPAGSWQLAPARLVAQLAEHRAAAARVAAGDVAGAHSRPLVLIPRRVVRRMNWQRFRDGDVPDALLNPLDATAAGISDGDRVEVSTAVGSLTLLARVTNAVVPGAVSIVHGFEDANVNAILDRHALDPLSGMAHLSAVPVEIRVAP